MKPTPDSAPDPASSSVPAAPPAGAQPDVPLRWAGHGNVGGFLLQVSILIAVNLGLWGVVFLMAMKFAGVLGPPVAGQ